MGYTSSFKDGVVYGAKDINTISRRLIGSGVLLPETSLAVTVSGGQVSIAPGTAVMGDGCTFEADTDGVSLPYQSGSVNYVYISNPSDAAACEPMCTTTKPAGDHVMLAEVSKTGTVTDKRVFARANILYNSAVFCAGRYSGTAGPTDHTPNTIALPFTPAAVLVTVIGGSSAGYAVELGVQGDVPENWNIKLGVNKFEVRNFTPYSTMVGLNASGKQYTYLAFADGDA